MTSPETLAYIVPLLVWAPFSIVLLVGMWAIKGRVPRKLYKKYSRRLIRRSQLPFAYAWRAQIERDDLPLLERARNRSTALGLAILLMGYSMAMGFNIQSAVALYRCNTTTGAPMAIPPISQHQNAGNQRLTGR